MLKSYFCLLSLCIGIPCVALADVSIPLTTDLPGHPSTPQYTFDGVSVNGYAEGAYNYLSQSPFFISGVPDRFLDINPNGFILNQASLTISKQPSQGFGGLVEMILGRDTYTMAPYGMKPGLDSQNAGFAVQQIYLQYAAEKLTTIGGIFYTLAGYESTAPNQNTNYSNSFIASYAEPTTVTGMRSTYAVNDKFNWVVGINDGWDNVRDWSRRKTLELGGLYTGNRYTFSAYWYNGQERATPFTHTGPLGMRNLVDLVGSVNLTDKLKLAANYDFVTQSTAELPDERLGRATFQGIAGYVEYQINSAWRTSFRSEFFSDPNGFATGVQQNLREFTLTFGYLVFKHLELRAETRRDISNMNSFQSKSGSSTSNHMQSFSLSSVLTF